MLGSKRSTPCDGLIQLQVDKLRIKRTRIEADSSASPTLQLPTQDGTIALLSDIGGVGGDCTLGTVQTFTAEKIFGVAPKMTSITSPSNFTLSLPNSSNGTIALLAQIPTNSTFVDLSSPQTITGSKTFSTAPQISTILNTGTLSLPTTSGTLALTSEIPDVSAFAKRTANEVIQNKKIALSSNTTIASFTSTTITTTRAHNLGVGDSIVFPVAGSITGVVAGTTYTVATVPTTTSFTLSGITLGGTLGTAYYVLSSRATANESTAGGTWELCDASNASNPIVFDTSANTIPCVFQTQSGTGAAKVLFPSFGGSVAVLENTQTFNGNKTFSGQLISTRAGQTTPATAPFYVNSATVAMSAANSYFWSYFNTPLSSGSSTGTSATVAIAGATTTAANNYSLRVIAGATSLPSGTVTTPSLVFSTGQNASGLYSSAANIINTAISGVNVHQVSSTGLSVTGITQSSTSLVSPLLRPITGNLIQSCPATDSTTGTAQLRISPTSGTWATNGTGELQLGDGNHYIRGINGFGMFISDTSAINLSTPNYYYFADNGTSSYLTYGQGGNDPIGLATYGLSFGAGASGKALNIFNDSFACVKLGTNADRQIMSFFRTPSGQVGSIAVTSAATAYNTLSDRRAKKNIKKIKERDGESVIDQIKKFNIYEYEFKADDSYKSIGFIADEIKDIYPEAVTLAKNEDELDMIDYSRLVPILAAGLKDVIEEMEDMRKEIRKLKGE